jgi:flagellar hook assembly protein FlgD
VELYAYPNPFNPSLTISYNLAEAGYVRLEVFNSRGQRVREIVNGYESKGNHQVNWDGDNSSGNFVAAGVYFLRLATSKETIIRKQLLLK